MGKRKPLDKAQARERRNRLLASAGAAELSLTEGVREMRTIAGMTQEEFARHRGVSARVIKAIELGQGNPTIATLNSIGQFFGLEVAFVPIKRASSAEVQNQPAEDVATSLSSPSAPYLTMSHEAFQKTMAALQAHIDANTRALSEALAQLNTLPDRGESDGKIVKRTSGSRPGKTVTGEADPPKTRKPRSR
jgi:DNA-binding XRE family transcriptional regulator